MQLQARQSRQEKKNKQIGDANLHLLEAITTVQSSHNPVSLEKVKDIYFISVFKKYILY